MMYPRNRVKFFSYARFVAVLSTVLLTLSIGAAAQEPAPTPNVEALPTGSYIIPMDNIRQGNAGGTIFNLRAYGLANALLQAGVPLKWAIRYDKTTSESSAQVDFTASVTKIAGVGGGSASGSHGFSGGPFIVYPGYEAAALPVITAFNTAISGTANDVVVYQTTALATADIRYTLTHKPLIAYGAGNGISTDVHTRLFDFARIPNYVQVDDSTVNAGTCVTIATQPHFTSTAFVSNYRTFVNSGGNLLLQCESIKTFENVSAPNGRFQTTGGYDDDNDNSSFAYPNPARPFSQFIGIVQDDQQGTVEDYVRDGGSFQNGTYVVLQTGDAGDNRYGATVSKINTMGPTTPGGMTFYLGGHDYFDGGNGPASNLAKTNAQRMILNAIFVPPTRPAACGIALGTPLVSGYKSVKLTTNVFPFSMGPGDQLTWTIDYVNTGSAAVTNFQINDIIPNVPPGVVTFNGPPVVTFSGAGTAAVVSGTYSGVAPNQGLLAAGATIGVNGRITVTVKTTVNLNNVTFQNQTTATGTGMPSVNSDNIDSTDTINTTAGTITAPGSIAQTHTIGIDPTAVGIFAPTSANASIDGQVRTAGGQAIRGANMTVTNLTTGAVTRAITNAFGFYSFTDLPVGDFYVVQVSAKRYRFSTSSVSFTLTDNVSGVTFVANGDDLAQPKVAEPVRQVTVTTIKNTKKEPK